MKTLQTSSTPRREAAVVLAMGLLMLLAAVLSLCLGAVQLTPAQLVQAIIQGRSNTLAGRIFWFVRLPRTLAALLTGAALAVSGVVLQTVLHNPLAAPNIIGVNAGAGFAVAVAAVSLAGIIGFVGLIVPHFVRQLTGEKLLPLLLSSALGGGAFVAACDTLARTAFAPYELPVGVVLSFLGVPVFLWQLLRSRRHRG